MNRKPLPLPLLVLLAMGLLCATMWVAVGGSAHAQPDGTPAAMNVGSTMSAAETSGSIKLWEPLTSSKYSPIEKILLLANVVVALAGLGYA